MPISLFSKMYKKPVILIFCGFVFSLLLERTGAENYCYMKDDKPYLNFSHCTAYENVRDVNMPVLPDCDVSYIFALIRHGTPYYGSPKLHDACLVMKDQILENHGKYHRGQLCFEDLQRIHNSTFKWTENVNGHLVPQGKADMRGIASRLKNKFGPYFDIFKGKFAFGATHYARTQESAVAFTNELFQTSFEDVAGNNIFINDELLLFGPWTMINSVLVPKEVEKFTKGKVVSKMISEVTKRLGYESDLTFNQISNLYVDCYLENAWSINSRPGLCAAFTPEHLRIMEYWLDLLLYYQVGYGNSTVGPLACPLIENLFVKLMTAVKDPHYSEKGSFYFLHVEILLPVMTQMELFHDEIPLRYDNYEAQKDRQWKIADLSPYASNLMVVLYKCKSELKIAFYKNEKLMKFHDCEDGICSVAKFEEIFTKKILKKCSRNNSSQIEVNIFSTIIVSIWVIWFSLKKPSN